MTNEKSKSDDMKWWNAYRTLHEASSFAKLSISTIMRAVDRGELFVSRKTGKNLTTFKHIKKWLEGR